MVPSLLFMKITFQFELQHCFDIQIKEFDIYLIQSFIEDGYLLVGAFSTNIKAMNRTGSHVYNTFSYLDHYILIIDVLLCQMTWVNGHRRIALKECHIHL